MLNLAKLLHRRAGFRITFVSTEFNHARLLRSHPSFFSTSLDDFQFATIPDGLPPPSDPDANQDWPELCEAARSFMPLPFSRLIATLLKTSSDESKGVTCILSDGLMSFTATPAAQKFNIPLLLLWHASASSFLALKHYRAIKDKLRPLSLSKDASSSEENTFLDTVIDWIPGMKYMRVRDLPNSIGTKDGDDDFLLNFTLDVVQNITDHNLTCPMIVNTFEALERDALDALSSYFTPIYSIGSLHLLNQVVDVDDRSHGLKQIKGNLWKEDAKCLEWLNSKEPNSVMYVNFGSLALLTQEQLEEFAMGLSNSKQPFLLIIRPDLVNQGDNPSANAVLPREFLEETKGRGFISGWCPQEEVLNHPSIGGFLTHCGWGSIMESLSAGVPMLCWPCFGDQKGNCRYVCSEWEMGLEIGDGVKRDDVERLVRKLMTDDGDDDETGKKLKKRAMEWKRMAHEAALGSSTLDFKKLVNYLSSIQN
ncbi:hypothetical protein BT93_J0677 [Corymbia citriodora subsp. variegata]|nr:hypothetical protein BT93_J0677 [Corymbia citriodora subsp. variegata]